MVPAEKFAEAEAVREAEAEAVSETHLHDCFRDPAVAGRIHRKGAAAPYRSRDKGKDLLQTLRVRQPFRRPFRREADEDVAGLLHFRGNDVAGLLRGDREGNESRRDVQLLKGAGHGVLAADGADAEVHLGIEGAEQGGEGLAPALRIAAGLFEILLQGKVNILKLRAARDQLRDRFHDSRVGAVVRAFAA